MAEDTSIGLVISTPQPLSTPSLRTMAPDCLSPLERLRQRRHDRWLEALRDQLAEVLVAFPCRVWLFGSRARGDWDGLSDTDLLVVAESAERAEQAADRLRSVGVGDDVLSLGGAAESALRLKRGTDLCKRLRLDPLRQSAKRGAAFSLP